jgi:membrane protease subunit (stomatin/prohibitin family)
VTSTTTSIPEPVTVTTSATVTTTATTRDTAAEMLYGSLMAVFLALFLATLVLLVGSRLRGSKGSSPQSSQAAITAPAQAHIATSYRCSACGTDVARGAKFCGNCGAQLKAK